ncbi:hypothetical protein CRG98_019174 [Punica granatum]|uniref:Uncharacterized protein n=1 Tax=Punica granatum TaxID=22663 RepID=A0A2I0JX48_PUNGR|nr:hypothetical protein CRG98_019174 [Punica granatum]
MILIQLGVQCPPILHQKTTGSLLWNHFFIGCQSGVILGQLGVQRNRPCAKRPPRSTGTTPTSRTASRPDCTDPGLLLPAESPDSLCHFSDSFLVFRG